jgi:hypothetical protein
MGPWIRLMFVLGLAAGVFAACGGDGGGDGEPVDVAGYWETTSTVVSDNCDGRVSQTFVMTIMQEDNTVTVELPDATFSGTVSGNRIQMTGSFPEDDGTVTVNATLVVSADGSSMQGSDDWTWTDGFESCSGSDSLSATRMIGQEFPCTGQGILDAIAEGGGPHTFSCDGPKTVVTDGDVAIYNDVILDGEGNLTVDGNSASDLLVVADGVTAQLHGVTVTNGGNAPCDMTEDGCAGIENRGVLTLSKVTVAENGFGIVNNGTLRINETTVSENEFNGIVNVVGTLTLTNSTVSGNGLEEAFEGGTAIQNRASITLLNSTLVGNGGGGDESVVFNWGTFVARNTLIVGWCAVAGPASAWSRGYNIESPAATCGVADEPTDQDNVTAEQLNLGPLADNGGPTMTHALGTDSVAIDQIPADDCDLDEDQRGEPRPETGGTMCDIGAFEVQP